MVMQAVKSLFVKALQQVDSGNRWQEDEWVLASARSARQLMVHTVRAICKVVGEVKS